MKPRSDIITDLASILSNFQGREYSEPIEGDTWFFADLGFASIDAIVLGEELESYYQRKIPFNHFLVELQKEDVRDIQVGRLATFLGEHVPG